MTDEEVARVAGSLTKAQREVLLRCDNRVWRRHEIHHRTFEALFDLGIASNLLAVGNHFFSWTEFGRTIRAYLKDHA